MTAAIACVAALAGSALAAGPAGSDEALFLPRTAEAGASALANGDFEAGARGWSPYGAGFEVVEGGRAGKAIRVRCGGAGKRAGAVARIRLAATRPVPVLVSGWSRAEGVEGGPSADYSIYVDAIYAGGRPLWGRNRPFRTGTHGWEKVAFIVAPSEPIRTLAVYALLRNRKGVAWFDDVRAVPLAGEGEGIFEGAPLRATDWPRLRPGPGLVVAPGGGIRWRDGGVPAPGGIAVRDVAADSGFLRPRWRAEGPGRGSALSDLGLALRYEARSRGPRAVELTLAIEDRAGRDRAVTVLVALPVDAATWYDDATRSRAIRAPGLYQFVAPVGAGATGTSSYYPLGCVGAGDGGVALGNPMDAPRIRRYAYDARFGLLAAAFDIGLAPEKPRADVRLVAFTFPPRWGFRAAWAAYQALHPRDFAKRVPKEGLWMAFLDIARVRGFEDFGFAFKEGANDVAFDDRHGILTFRYTEPQSHWQKMPADADRSYEGCVAFLERRAREGDEAARAAIASAVRDAEGRYVLQVRDTPWCDGCVFTLNPNPRLPGEITKARRNYTREAADTRYRGGAGGIDGEYLDSLEGWSLARDFDRSHFACAATPLVFDARTHRPCVLNAFNIFAFTRFVSEDLHRRGKLLMANATPIRFPFLLPLLDLAGIEIDWKRGGRFAPDAEWWMDYRRALSGAKPYLFLMNTDFARWTKEDTERYMRRALHYAFFPSFFSANASTKHYFARPALYERDRPLFRRYVPWIRRLGRAGWRPIPYATARPEVWRVERYGPDGEGRVYWTVLNAAGQAAAGDEAPGEKAAGEVALELDALALAGRGPYRLGRPLADGALQEGRALREGDPAGVWRVPLRIAAGDTTLIALEPAAR